MSIASSIRIVELSKSEIKQAAALLSATMASNPIHLAAFGSSGKQAVKKQQKMFEYALSQAGKKIYGAKLGGELVGVMCYSSSQCCQLKPLELLGILPKMFFALGRPLLPVLAWQKKWSKHDYPLPHSHFGPLAVSTVHQGKGIGKALLKFFCNYLDETSQLGYLETDKRENVSLYQKFGFKVMEEDTVLGIKNWFMVREMNS